MTHQQLLAAIAQLSHAHGQFLTVRPGQQASQTYEVSELVRAANEMAKRLANLPADSSGIPF